MTDSTQTGHSRKRVLFLCTGNSCRSQMAEALWRRLAGDAWEVVSAGTKPADEIYPHAVTAMAEVGLDLRGQRPKTPDGFTGTPFDLVVTVCNNAEQECPTFAGAKRKVHWPFDDPPRAPGGEAEKLAACRRVRDEIEARIRKFLAEEK
ncbi:MAG: arsenate reductase ArsC [Phycisphaerae bacterium]|nr:arsenate reductase ArsC [Phycisphaerae bacterium]NUQ46528.1 arsenate reductase ArsC [Phycisphaerae bacterium]